MKWSPLEREAADQAQLTIMAANVSRSVVLALLIGCITVKECFRGNDLLD
jgi:hypothetical protein